MTSGNQPSVDLNEISEWTLQENPGREWTAISGGDLRKAIQKPAEGDTGSAPTEPTHLIKIFDKSDAWAADAYNTELGLTAKFRHRAVHKATSFFEDAQHYYIAYPYPRGQRLSGSLRGNDELAKKLSIQYLYFILWCHKNGLAYLRHRFDNIWYEDRGRLILVGCDTAAELPEKQPAGDKGKKGKGPALKSFSPILQKTADLTVADWFSVGLFVGKVAGQWDGPWAKVGEPVSTGSVAAGNPVKELVDKLTDLAQIGATGYNPKEEEYFQTQLQVQLLETRFAIGEFHVDWSDGIRIGYGATDVGFEASSAAVFIESEGAKLSIGAEGFKLEDTSDNWRGPTGIYIGPEGLELKYFYSKYLKFDAEGIHISESWRGADVELGPNGLSLTYKRKAVKLLDGQLDIDPDIKDDVKLKLKPLSLGIGSKSRVLFAMPFRIEGPTSYIQLGADGLELHMGTSTVRAGPAGIFLEAGPAQFEVTFKPAAVNIALSDTTFSISEEGLKFSSEGFNFELDSSGQHHIYNENASLDLGQYTFQIPSVRFTAPSIKLPGAPPPPKPPGPSMPAIPAMPSFGGGEKAGKIEDHLKDGETVKAEVDVERRRKFFFKKTVHFIRTSTDRLFFVSQLYGEQRGPDLVLASDSKIEKVKDNTLKVTTKGKATTIVLKDASKTEEWKGYLEEVKAVAH
jgi:hypothetical protein